MNDRIYEGILSITVKDF